MVNGKIPIDYYQYFNPSEFWAVNSTRILDGRYQVRGTWVGKAKQYLIELLQKAKNIFGLQSDAPIIRGLEAVLRISLLLLPSGHLDPQMHQQNHQDPASMKSTHATPL